MPISSIPLPGDEEPADASSQVAWLRSMGDREALFQIMEGDRRSMEALQAAEALAQLGDVRGLDRLIATVNDAHSSLRMDAAEILQGLGHPRGLRALREIQTETQTSPRAEEREQIYADLSAATTDELMAIWHENDRTGWTDLELEVVEGILLERLGRLPRRAEDSSDVAEVDEEADARIRQLWMQGDTESLRRIAMQENSASLQMDAAEALADLGDEGALDALIETLDDDDEERSDTAARILDWLDVPRGNAALRERGYEFSGAGLATSEMQMPAGAAAPLGTSPLIPAPRPVSGGPVIDSKEQPSWMPRSPRVPTQSPDTASAASLGVILTGALGGLIGFLGISVALNLLGIRALPNGPGEWFTPSVVYGTIESLAVGALSAGVGRKAARAWVTRDGDDVDEQDARLVLGPVISGAAAAALLGLLRFVFGS